MEGNEYCLSQLIKIIIILSKNKYNYGTDLKGFLYYYINNAIDITNFITFKTIYLCMISVIAFI